MRQFWVLAIALLLAGLSVTAATPRRTARTLRKTASLNLIDTVVATPPSQFDTIAPTPGTVRITGFEKTIRARKESFLLTNNTADTLQSVCVDIEYRDTRGRQLHRRQVWVAASVPPGQTRRCDIPSWDRQQTYYYRIHPRPRRSDAVPFDVSISVPVATIFSKLQP